MVTPSRMPGGIPENTLLPKGSQGKTSGDHVTVGLCVPKDSDGRTPELLRNTGLEDSSPAQEGAAHARGPGNLLQETGPGLPAFSERTSKA